MIDFGCDPIRVFAVPWVPDSDDWDDIVDYGHLVLDRTRAASLLRDWDAGPQMKNWWRAAPQGCSFGLTLEPLEVGCAD